jgi:MFS family permease
MSDTYNKGLFYDWVPKPVMLLLIIVYLFPLLSVSGVYTSLMQDMVGSTGLMSEHIQMAMNAGTIGMAALVPLMMKLKIYFRIKYRMIFCLLGMALFSFAIAYSEDPYVLIFGSFIIGLLKMMTFVEFMLPLMFIISPDGNRGPFYAVFYPLMMASGQISNYLFAKMAYDTNWQSVHVYVGCLMLFLALLSVIFMHHKYFSKPTPLYYVDWLSVVLFVALLMCLNYFLSFTKQQGWFSSTTIQASLVGFVFFSFWFAVRQTRLIRPLMLLRYLAKHQLLKGTVLILFLGIFMGSSILESSFRTGVLGYDNVTNNRLNLVMIPGIVFAGIIGIFWFKKNRPLKYFILIGFVCYTLYAGYMYFLIAPVIDIEYFIFPLILRGMGMTILFIGIWFYTLDGIPMGEMLASIGIFMSLRTFIAPAIFISFFSWALYQLQWQSVGNLTALMDGMALSNQTGGLAIYGQVQMQAILAATKTLFGYIIIAGFGIQIYVLFSKFGKMNYIKFLFIRRANKKSEKLDIRLEHVDDL